MEKTVVDKLFPYIKKLFKSVILCSAAMLVVGSAGHDLYGCDELGENRKLNQETPFVIDENNHIVIKIKLSGREKRKSCKKYRFILDTGMSDTALDESISSDFYVLNKRSRLIRDQTTMEFEAYDKITIFGIGVGTIVKKSFPAILMNIKNGPIGSHEDHPVDGILGMDFLAGVKFVIDPFRKVIKWGEGPTTDSYCMPIKWCRGVPFIEIGSNTGDRIKCFLDTGSARGIELPPGMFMANKTYSSGVAIGLSGKAVPRMAATVDCLRFGDSKIRNVIIEVRGQGDMGCIGQSFFVTTLICFDFKNDIVWFPVDEYKSIYGHCLHPSYIPVQWRRNSRVSKLIISKLNKDDRWFNSGFREGDEILQISKHTKNISIKLIKDLVIQGNSINWKVVRNGMEIEITSDWGKDFNG